MDREQKVKGEGVWLWKLERGKVTGGGIAMLLEYWSHALDSQCRRLITFEETWAFPHVWPQGRASSPWWSGWGERLAPLSQLCLVPILPEGRSCHLPSPPWFHKKCHSQHGPASYLPRFIQDPTTRVMVASKGKMAIQTWQFSICSQIRSWEQDAPSFPGLHLIGPSSSYFLSS